MIELMPAHSQNGSAIDPVLLNDWYPVARSSEMQPGTVHSVRLFDTDLVLWRGENTAVMAWLDRCPHRSVKLSPGTVEADTLICPYHGLAFDASGRCVKVPAHPNYAPPRQACTKPFQ